MNKINNKAAGAYLFLASLAATPAWATNGTQLTGYGTKAMGMGGVAIAFPQDAMAGASNPAGMAFVGHRLTVDAQLIALSSEGSFGGIENEGTGLALVPEFGYSRPLNDQWSIGIVNASGGGTVRYDDQLFTGASDGTNGLYLSTVVLPTVTYRPTPDLAFGVSLAVAVHGLEIEDMPGLPNHGMELATGFGWRAGAMWRATDTLAFGATYASKISMGELSGYSDDILLGVDGEVDLPEEWGVGFALELGEALTLAGDYRRIKWGDTQFQDLFGFQDQDVFRLGLAYLARPDLVLRTGVSIADLHFDKTFIDNNALLVAVNPKSVSAGFTKTFENGRELSGALEYDFGGRVDGRGASAGSYIDTDLVILSVGYGWTF